MLGKFENDKPSEITALAAVNFDAPMRLALAALGEFKQKVLLIDEIHKKGFLQVFIFQKSGIILFTASGSAFSPTPGMVVYSATKVFVFPFSYALIATFLSFAL